MNRCWSILILINKLGWFQKKCSITLILWLKVPKKHDVEKVGRKGGVKETHLMALPFISSMYYMVHWAHGKTRDKQKDHISFADAISIFQNGVYSLSRHLCLNNWVIRNCVSMHFIFFASYKSQNAKILPTI